MHYRLYVFANNQRIVRGIDLDCPDDDAAITAAHAHENRHGLELWQRQTRVAFIAPRAGVGEGNVGAARDRLAV